MLLVLIGKKNVGKETVASILENTEKFSNVDWIKMRGHDWTKKLVTVVEDMDIPDFLDTVSYKDGEKPIVFIELLRPGISKDLGEERYGELCDFRVLNVDIVKTVKSVLELYNLSEEVYTKVKEMFNELYNELYNNDYKEK